MFGAGVTPPQLPLVVVDGRGRVSDTDSLVLVGRCGAPYGVKGWLHITSYTSPPKNLVKYRPWVLGSAIAGTTARTLEPLVIKAHRNAFVAQLPNINDRDAAAALRGQDICVAASQLPAAGSDEYYWRDLIGLQVAQKAVGVVGVVADLLETGVHDVLCVSPTLPGAPEILIPFVAKYVQNVDLETKIIDVDWPELDPNEAAEADS